MRKENEIIDLVEPEAEPSTSASTEDCWDTPMVSGDLSDLSSMTAGLGQAFFDNMGMDADTLEVPEPSQWTHDSLLGSRGAKQTGGSSRLSNWNLGSIGSGQPLPSVNAGMDARQSSVPALDEGSLAVPAGFDFMGTGARAMGGGAVSEISGPSSLGGVILDLPAGGLLANSRHASVAAGGGAAGVSSAGLPTTAVIREEGREGMRGMRPASSNVGDVHSRQPAVVEVEQGRELDDVREQEREWQMQDELARVKRQRDELQQRLRQMEAITPQSPEAASTALKATDKAGVGFVQGRSKGHARAAVEANSVVIASTEGTDLAARNGVAGAKETNRGHKRGSASGKQGAAAGSGFSAPSTEALLPDFDLPHDEGSGPVNMMQLPAATAASTVGDSLGASGDEPPKADAEPPRADANAPDSVKEHRVQNGVRGNAAAAPMVDGSDGRKVDEWRGLAPEQTWDIVPPSSSPQAGVDEQSVAYTGEKAEGAGSSSGGKRGAASDEGRSAQGLEDRGLSSAMAKGAVGGSSQSDIELERDRGAGAAGGSRQRGASEPSSASGEDKAGKGVEAQTRNGRERKDSEDRHPVKSREKPRDVAADHVREGCWGISWGWFTSALFGAQGEKTKESWEHDKGKQPKVAGEQAKGGKKSDVSNATAKPHPAKKMGFGGGKAEKSKNFRHRRGGGDLREDEEEDENEKESVLAQIWEKYLCEVEQDLGSCIFTVVYFSVYFLLHGPTVRLAIIGGIVVVQFSFQIQYPKSVWDPINRMMDVMSNFFDGAEAALGGGDAASARDRGGSATSAATAQRGSAAAAAQRGRAAAAARRLGGSAPPLPVKVRKMGGGFKTYSTGLHVVSCLAWVLFGFIVLVTLSDISGGLGGGDWLTSLGDLWIYRLDQILMGGGGQQEGFRERAVGGGAGGSMFNTDIKVSLQSTKQADRLCDEAQKAEHARAWSDVQSKLQRALQLDPKHVCSLYNYGRLLDYVWNNPDKAESMYRRAIAADPKHTASLRNLGYFLYYVRRNYAEASEMWSKALKENPRELDVLSGYASLHYHVFGDLDKAEKLFNSALKVQPSHTNTLHNLAKMLHYARVDVKSAEVHYKTILEKVPNHIGALLDYAGLLHEHHSQLNISKRVAIDKAVELWERVVQLNPGHIDAVFLLARAEHMVRGKTNKAERLYKKLLADNNNHLNALINYAILLREQGRRKAAEEKYATLIERLDGTRGPGTNQQDVRWASSLVAYGDLLVLNRKNHNKAGRIYQRALLSEPTKTLEVASRPGHRCWLCSNSSRTQVVQLSLLDRV